MLNAQKFLAILFYVQLVDSFLRTEMILITFLYMDDCVEVCNRDMTSIAKTSCALSSHGEYFTRFDVSESDSVYQCFVLMIVL